MTRLCIEQPFHIKLVSQRGKEGISQSHNHEDNEKPEHDANTTMLHSLVRKTTNGTLKELERSVAQMREDVQRTTRDWTLHTA